MPNIRETPLINFNVPSRSDRLIQEIPTDWVDVGYAYSCTLRPIQTD